jgi:hypothetical protein
MAAYRPGDYYVSSSGMVMQWDGTSWKSKGQSLAPGGQDAIKNGRPATAPGAARNPVVAEETGIATQQVQANNSQFGPDPTIPIIAAPTVNNSSASTSLRYPDNITASETDYVSFEFFEYNPPFGKGQGQGGLNAFSASTAYNFYNASGLKDNAKSAKAIGLNPIILYMPEDIQAQYGARWGGADFGTAAVGMMRLPGGKTPAPDVTFSATNGMIKSKVYDTVLKGINSMTGSNISLDQFMGSVSGTILNPNTEMLYQGGDLRTFALTFKMTPKNGTEAVKIKTICNTFKKAMLPDIGGQSFFGSEAASLLKVPNLCQVTYMRGSKIHEYLPVYKLCAIAGVDVNYTPDGAYATYEGGSPVSTQLTISFKETKLLFSNDVNLKGYSY